MAVALSRLSRLVLLARNSLTRWATCGRTETSRASTLISFSSVFGVSLFVLMGNVTLVLPTHLQISRSFSRFALRYGAAVIYSGKDSGNKFAIYRYLIHRAYGVPFKDGADITHPEATFIPSGALDGKKTEQCCYFVAHFSRLFVTPHQDGTAQRRLPC